MASSGFRIQGSGPRQAWSLGPALRRAVDRLILVLVFWSITAAGLAMGVLLDHSPLSQGGHWWQGIILAWVVAGLLLGGLRGLDPCSRSAKRGHR
jgi:hypothetical protein